MIALIPVLFLAGFVGLLVVIVQYSSHREEQRRRVWLGVAQQLGLHHDGSTITGRRHGRNVRAGLVSRGSGKSKTTYTVVSGMLDAPLDLGLYVRDHGFLQDLFNSSPDVQLGDPPFDARFLVNGDEDWRVRTVLSPALRRLLFLSPGLTLNDHGLSTEVVGATHNGQWLAAALDTVGQGAALLEQARAHVPTASPLAPHRHAWEAFARAHGLEGQGSPLCMWGRIGGADVYAYSARVGRLAYQLDVSVRFSQPLGVGLSVQSPSFVDEVKEWFGGGDIRVGDPTFDEKFTVRARDPQRAVELLGPDVRREILGMQHALGPVRISDDGLTVRLPFVPHDPSVVPRTVHGLAALAERIGGHASIARGAYR